MTKSRTSRTTSKRAVPVTVALALFLLTPALLHAQSITVEKGKIEVTKGKIESKGDVTVSGALAPTLELGEAATLTLGDQATLTIGDGGRIYTPSTTTAPVVTSEEPGNKFYTFVVASNGTFEVTALKIVSVDEDGLTLEDGSVIPNNTVSGLTFDYVKSGATSTALRFRHATGTFTVSNNQFVVFLTH